MKPGGLLLVVLGVWVVAQVTRGHALERLGLVPRPKEGDESLLDKIGGIFS